MIVHPHRLFTAATLTLAVATPAPAARPEHQSSIVTAETAAWGSGARPPGRSLAGRSACIIGPGGTMVALIAILVVLWMLGIVTKNTLGGFLHILLVVAIIFLLIRVIRGRPV
jgi:hypothetical protein